VTATRVWGDYAWFDDNADEVGEEYAHCVAQKKPNSFGLLDMHGNVCEWCQDWYAADYYANSPPSDPPGASAGSGRVIRGGAWSNSRTNCRSASRCSLSPSDRYFNLGFRVVCCIAPSAKARAAGQTTRTSGVAEPKGPPEEPKPAAGIAKEKPAERPAELAQSSPAEKNARGKAAEGKPIERKPAAKPPRTPEFAVVPFDETQAKRHQKAWADHLGVDVEITNSIGMRLALIPPGEFMMGSPESEEHRSDDEHQHRVRITTAFRLGATEVTQGQWEAVMGTRPWSGERNVKEGTDYAVTYVSWEDGQAFCERLSNKEGARYRLPSEAEWEYACRAGTTSAYHFGEDGWRLGDYAWFHDNAYHAGERYAHQVGQKKANAFGLFDMYGNVSEWCSDWYGDDYYPDPGVPEGSPGSPRVLRGGCWGSWRGSVRSWSALRNGCSSEFRSSTLGFRVARSLSGE